MVETVAIVAAVGFAIGGALLLRSAGNGEREVADSQVRRAAELAASCTAAKSTIETLAVPREDGDR